MENKHKQKQKNPIISSFFRIGPCLCDRRLLSLRGDRDCHNAALVPPGATAAEETRADTASSPTAPGAMWAITKMAECTP